MLLRLPLIPIHPTPLFSLRNIMEKIRKIYVKIKQKQVLQPLKRIHSQMAVILVKINDSSGQGIFFQLNTVLHTNKNQLGLECKETNRTPTMCQAQNIIRMKNCTKSERS